MFMKIKVLFIKLRKFIFYSFFSFIITNCNSLTKQPTGSQKKLEHILNMFINKTPNELYDAFGKPNNYNIEYNSKKQIVKAIIVYDYVYNFYDKKYECQIRFITNKAQDKIITADYSSEKCFYITSY